ncbi:MAG: C2H2-type zinc finger protein [Thermoprotei archaeon]
MSSDSGYECPVCGKHFGSKQALGGHAKNTHGVLPRRTPQPVKHGDKSVTSVDTVATDNNPRMPLLPTPPQTQVTPNVEPVTAVGTVPLPLTPTPTTTPQRSNNSGGGVDMWAAVAAAVLPKLVENLSSRKPDPFSQMAYEFFGRIVQNSADQILDAMRTVNAYRVKGTAEADREEAKRARREQLEEMRKIIRQAVRRELEEHKVEPSEGESESEEPPH